MWYVVGLTTFYKIKKNQKITRGCQLITVDHLYGVSKKELN